MYNLIESKLTNDKNYCSVVAVHVLTGLSIEDAQKSCKQYGNRKINSGMSTKDLLKVLECIGYGSSERYVWFTECLKKGKEVKKLSCKTFARKYKKGTYLCASTNHFFVVKDGIVYDTRKHLNRVLRAYKVYPKKLKNKKHKKIKTF